MRHARVRIDETNRTVYADNVFEQVIEKLSSKNSFGDGP